MPEVVLTDSSVRFIPEHAHLISWRLQIIIDSERTIDLGENVPSQNPILMMPLPLFPVLPKGHPPPPPGVRSPFLRLAPLRIHSSFEAGSRSEKLESPRHSSTQFSLRKYGLCAPKFFFVPQCERKSSRNCNLISVHFVFLPAKKTVVMETLNMRLTCCFSIWAAASHRRLNFQRCCNHRFSFFQPMLYGECVHHPFCP